MLALKHIYVENHHIILFLGIVLLRFLVLVNFQEVIYITIKKKFLKTLFFIKKLF